MTRMTAGLDDLAAIRLDIEKVAGAAAARRLIGLGAGLTLGLVLVLLAWATVAQLGSAVVSTGVVAGNHQTVQHPDGGVVSAILVKEGQFVRKGQEVIRLDPLQSEAALDSYVSNVDTYTAIVARLEAEASAAPAVTFPASLTSRAGDPAVAQIMRTQEALFRARRSDIVGAGDPTAQQAAQAMNMAHGLEGQIAALDQQEALVQQQLTGLRELAAKGFAPQSRVMALQQSQSSIAGQRQQYEGQIASYRNEAAQARAQLNQVRRARQSEIAAQLADARSNLAAALERRRAAQDVVDRTVVRAPVDGHVIGLSTRTVGGVVGRGERILEIVPTNASPLVEAHISPSQADHIHVGMKAELKLLGPDGRNLPRIDGTVTRRSSDLLADPKTGQAYVEVEVAVAPKSLARLSAAKFTPGTPVEVILPLRSRSALEYMIEPLTDSLRYGLRE
jgi:HlyD family type I secretion membrane fusion protein